MSRTLSGCGLVAVLALSGAASAADKPAPAYAVVGRIAGPDGGWDLLDIASARHRLYVARTSGVMAVDLDTLAVTPTLLTTQRGHSAMRPGCLPIRYLKISRSCGHRCFPAFFPLHSAMQIVALTAFGYSKSVGVILAIASR